MKSIKQSRGASFGVILLIYIFVSALGIMIYRALDFEYWLSLLIADVAATAVTYIFSLIFSNASVYDPYWSVQPPVILTAFLISGGATVYGALILAAVSFWAIRLTANWAYTFYGLDHQDWRYTMLKEKTGAFYPIVNFVGIHLVPTLVVYLCILPGVYAVYYRLEADFVSILFLSVSLGAVFLQGIADIQMHSFRKNRNGTFIRNGLWKYSRHPNYLAEILMWWGIGLSVAFATGEWNFVLGAVANNALFLFVSIPLADGRQSRKDGFAEYKSQTRMLLPIKKHLLSGAMPTEEKIK